VDTTVTGYHVTGGGAKYQIFVDAVSSDGTVVASVPASAAVDVAGNANSASTSTDNRVTYDATRPTVLISAPSVSVTGKGPVTYTVTYDGAATVTLGLDDVTLIRTGSANATVEVTETGPEVRTVTLTGITGDGTLGIALRAGTAADQAGNMADGAAPSAAFSVDNTTPTFSCHRCPVPGPSITCWA